MGRANAGVLVVAVALTGCAAIAGLDADYREVDCVTDCTSPTVTSFVSAAPRVFVRRGTTLTWATQGTRACTIEPGALAVGTSGSIDVVPLRGATTYTLRCDTDSVATPVVSATVSVESIGVKTIATGAYHSCAVLDSGALKCWGFNLRHGTLGLGDKDNRGDGPDEAAKLPDVPLGAPGVAEKVARVVAGFHHTCVVLEARGMKCFGRNDHGQSGQGDTNDRGDAPDEMGDKLPVIAFGDGLVPKLLGARTEGACVVFENGKTKCWGTNTDGQLGIGDAKNRGELAGDMASLPFVDVGPGRTVTVLGDGVGSHSCVVLDDGTVKCWGPNKSGQLGLGDKLSRGLVPAEMGAALPVVPLAGTPIALALGGAHTCAILQDGRVKCWGDNRVGQLGIDDRGNRGDEPNELGDKLPAVDLGGRKAKGISGGAFHTCAVLEDGKVKCWGWNESGELGLGDKVDRAVNAGEMAALPEVDLGAGIKAVAIAAGWQHSCALIDDGRVKCWGYGNDGQLGLGDQANRGEAAGQMGDALPFVPLNL